MQLPHEASANFVGITGADDDGVRGVRELATSRGSMTRTKVTAAARPNESRSRGRREDEKRYRDQEGVLLGENGQGDQHARSDPPTAQRTGSGRQGETQRHEVLGVERVLEAQPHGREAGDDHEERAAPSGMSPTRGTQDGDHAGHEREPAT